MDQILKANSNALQKTVSGNGQTSTLNCHQCPSVGLPRLRKSRKLRKKIPQLLFTQVQNLRKGAYILTCNVFLLLILHFFFSFQGLRGTAF